MRIDIIIIKEYNKNVRSFVRNTYEILILLFDYCLRKVLKVCFGITVKKCGEHWLFHCQCDYCARCGLVPVESDITWCKNCRPELYSQIKDGVQVAIDRICEKWGKKTHIKYFSRWLCVEHSREYLKERKEKGLLVN